jgi:hypothetical protein
MKGVKCWTPSAQNGFLNLETGAFSGVTAGFKYYFRLIYTAYSTGEKL